jgi:hypothetical protein
MTKKNDRAMKVQSVLSNDIDLRLEGFVTTSKGVIYAKTYKQLQKKK